jgi:hypothetical protein
VKPVSRLLFTAAGLLVAGLSLGCNNEATAPEDPQFLSSGVEASSTLMTCRKLPYESTSAWIGPLGGKLKAGPNALYVPAGALSEVTWVTLTSPSGSTNRVTLSPSQAFNRDYPALLVMSYEHCAVSGGASQRIVHLDYQLGVVEETPARIDPDSRTVKSKLTGFVLDVLFSTYAVAY